jgi:hypothetical protein
MSFSDFLELKILEHITGKTAYSMPTVYVGLSTADPLDTGAGLAEPSGGSYVRKSTAGADWSTAAAGSINNANDVTFVESTASWGTITHFAIFDAVSGGNMLGHGELTSPQLVGDGKVAKFLATTLTITLD